MKENKRKEKYNKKLQKLLKSIPAISTLVVPHKMVDIYVSNFQSKLIR